QEHAGELPCSFAVMTSYPGIGPKCANLALGIACNQPRIGVDIHVHRITNRWGYLSAHTPDQTMAALESILPPPYWVEINVLLLLLVSALDGTRRGLLLGTLDLLAAALAFVVALVVERPLGDRLVTVLPALSSPLAHLAAFLGILVAVQFAIGLTLGRLVLAVARRVAAGPLAGLDRLLGILPGLARGAVTIALFLLPFALLPFLPSVSRGVE